MGPNGCELGTWTCPGDQFGAWYQGRFLSYDELLCIGRQHKIRAKAIELNLNYEILDHSNYCVDPKISAPKRSFFDFFDPQIVLDAIKSGDIKEQFDVLFPRLLPAYKIPILADKTGFEQVVTLAAAEAGIHESVVHTAFQIGEAIGTSGIGKAQSAATIAQGAKPMALSWFDDLAGGVGDFFSGLKFTDILNVASPIVANTFSPQQTVVSRPAAPAQSFVPTYNALQFGVPGMSAATPVMSVMPAMGTRVAAMIAPVLFKISQTVGRNVSLQKALTLARSLGKQLQSPAAAAAALGITLAELAQLIVVGQHRKRRRMNPANSKALRKAARRIESFHRLCARTDMLRSRGRRRSVGRCGSCKKSPCRC